MKILKGEGRIIQHVASGAILSGDPVVLDNRVGIAIADIADTYTGSVLVEGHVEVNKVSAQAWAIGNPIFWDNTAKLFTTVAAGNTIAGYASAPAANPSSTGRLMLAPAYKKAATVAALAQTISGTYSQSEVQAISTKVDAILTALKNAGLMA